MVSSQSPRPLQLVVATGATVALCIMGDSLLYNLLPLEAEQLGISAFWVGVLLSANRLVRLFSNSWLSRVFERLGPRIPFVGAAVLALITTTIYGVGWGVLAFLIARVGWGIAWSALRQGGFQAVWAGNKRQRGRFMGIWWGIVRLGSAASVLIGGALYDRHGYRAATLLVIGLAVLAIPIAIAVSWSRYRAADRATQIEPGSVARFRLWKGLLDSAQQRWLLGSGLLHCALEGVLVSTLSLFIAGQLEQGELQVLPGFGVATVAGLLLAVRYVSNLLFGPALGALSDRVGQPQLAVILGATMLCGVIGMVTSTGLWPLLFISLIVIAGAGLFVTLSAAANGIALRTQRPHRFVGFYTTAADAGLASGPLIAYSLSSVVGLAPIYLGAALLLLLALLNFLRSSRDPIPEA
jgi:MFS family permease